MTKAGLKTSISNTSKTYEWLSNMKQNDKPYKCGYCGSSYVREKTLFAHMCEKKRRALQKDEKRVRYGFYAFGRFYKLSYMKNMYYNLF